MGNYHCPHCGMAGQLDPRHAQLPHWPVLCHNCYRFGEPPHAAHDPSQKAERKAGATVTCLVCHLTLSLLPKHIISSPIITARFTVRNVAHICRLMNCACRLSY